MGQDCKQDIGLAVLPNQAEKGGFHFFGLQCESSANLCSLHLVGLRVEILPSVSNKP